MSANTDLLKRLKMEGTLRRLERPTSEMALRVLHVTPYFAPAYCYGGPPRSVLALCRALQSVDIDVAVVTTSANGLHELPSHVIQAGEFHGIPVRYVPRRFPKRYFFARGLRPLLEAMIQQYDIVHIHGYWNFVCSTSASVCRRARRPYILSPRGMLDSQAFARSRWKKRLAYRLGGRTHLTDAAAWHVTTEAERQHLARLCRPPRIQVIPNVIELEEFDHLPSGAEFRRRLGIRSDERTVITVGRVHPQKGLDLLLESFRLIVREHPTTRLVVVGDGDGAYREMLEQKYGDLTSSGNCRFAGHLQGRERLEAYAAADLFVSASKSESFGMSVAEAIAAGLPVVVTRECPWPQIEQWSCGSRVDRTPAAFAEAITQALHDRNAFARQSRNAARQLRETFGPIAIATQMARLYEESLKSRTGTTNRLLTEASSIP